MCVERLIGKQKKPILFKVTEPSSVPYRAPPACAKITGPLLSLVFRTEDVWQRYNQFIETAEFSIRVSPSRSYNAGRAGLGWASGWLRGNVYAASSDCVVVLALGDLVAWRHFVRASRGPLSVLLSVKFKLGLTH